VQPSADLASTSSARRSSVLSLEFEEGIMWSYRWDRLPSAAVFSRQVFLMSIAGGPPPRSLARDVDAPRTMTAAATAVMDVVNMAHFYKSLGGEAEAERRSRMFRRVILCALSNGT
jgi:hypothetical protein